MYGVGGAGDGVKEKQRHVEIKVYTRKVFKGFKKNKNNNTNSIAGVDTVATSVIENKEVTDGIPNKETSIAPTITTPTPTNTNNDNDDSNVNSGVNNDSDNSLPRPLTVTEDENSTPKQPISRTDTASDDSSCHNRLQVAAGDDVQSIRNQPSANGVVEKSVQDHSNSSLALRFNHEAHKLRHKLESELEIVRNVLERIEAKQGKLSEASNFHGSVNEGMNKVREDYQIHPEVAAICVPREPSRPLIQPSIRISMLENSQGFIDYVEKEKRTPKAIPLYRSSEVLFENDKLSPAEACNFYGSVNGSMYQVGEAEDNHIHPEVAAVCVPREPSRPLIQSSIRISMLEKSRGMIDYVEKEKRTPKEIPLYQSSEFLLGNDKLPPAEASNFHGSVNEGMYKVREDYQIRPEVAAVHVPCEPSRPLNQSSISVLENSQGVIDYVEKEKRTPKANPLYPSSEFLLGNDKLPPAESNKKAKMNIKKLGVGKFPPGFGLSSKFFKNCSSLLDRLIKHKYGWVFDAPVDVEGLGLHDYHTTIKHPMDLGTVKSRLIKNWYKLPKEFAEDVRLTFRNAMTYNPPGQDVHAMADQLSTIFEDRWAGIESDYNREMRFGLDYGAALSTRTFRKVRFPPLDVRQIWDRSESTSYHLDSQNKPLASTPVARTPASRKPLAKDPYKRDMTFEEKQKLSSNLQSLLSVRPDAIIEIVKKRNSGILQDDEQIEVEIDSMDAETLWELDRLVINYRKSMNKKKRKAALALLARGDDRYNIAKKAPVLMEVPNETKADENIVSSSVLVQGLDNSRSRSSSSISSSIDSGSSSSGSDSDSSSTSGSDSGF